MDDARNSYTVLHAGKDKQEWVKTESRKPQPLCYDVMLFTVKIIGVKRREKPNCRMHQVPPLECRPPAEPQRAQREREDRRREKQRQVWKATWPGDKSCCFQIYNTAAVITEQRILKKTCSVNTRFIRRRMDFKNRGRWVM